MISIDPNSLTQKENYKFLIGSIIPRPIAFITTESSDGVVNAAPFSFFNIVSSEPPILSISIQRKEGDMKDTARNILATKELVVHIVDEDIVEEVNKTAANLTPQESEVGVTNFTLVPSEKVSVPSIKETKIRMEAVLTDVIEIKNDNGDVVSDLVLARVVRYSILEELYKNGRIDPDGLNPVSRLAGNDYATLGEKITVARPKG